MQPLGRFSGAGGRQPVMTLQITCTMFRKGYHASFVRLLPSCVSMKLAQDSHSLV